jgi:MYXO-CTERM domain-containing protein
MKPQLFLPVAASMVPLLTANASLFSEPFDAAESSSSFLLTRVASSTDVITFGYDYSGKGIPEAPSTPVGAEATRGLFLQANKPAAGSGAINGINLTAAAGGVALVFSQEIRLSFDMWLNYFGSTNTTEQALFGINTDGAGVNSRTGSTQTGADGVWYHVATEGGYGATSTAANSRDVVNYIGNSVPPGGRLDNNDAPFPALFPNADGILGTPGNQWVRVVVEETGGNVRMTMNGTEVFNVVNTGPTSGSVFIGYQDPFSSSLADPATSFAVFDNVTVTAVPEPEEYAAAAAAALVGFAVWRRSRRA